MLYEYDKGRKLIKNLEDALANRHAVDFSFFANQYARLPEDHIAKKEDNVLFPRANRVLSQKDDAMLLQRFHEIEHAMGEETHERFHQLLDRLAKHYHVQTARVL